MHEIWHYYVIDLVKIYALDTRAVRMHACARPDESVNKGEEINLTLRQHMRQKYIQ